MYLMDVPPVVVTRPEWRPCGTPGGYSLPLCLNDSDSDLSTRGTPITDKVQMIIESLRSTQSSVEMGDEKERKAPSGQDGHSQVCKSSVGSFVGSNSNAQAPTLYQQLKPSAVSNESHDSDSDDSVDRGIEAAILEYLKEKDGPKRKSETCTSDTLQPSKIPRRTSPTPGISKSNSDCDTFLTACKEFPKSVTLEELITPTSYPIKKYIKHKTSINEEAFTKQELYKNMSVKSDISVDPTNQPSTYLSDVTKMTQNLEELSDSSSDDGIEEAIQKYQIEKNQQMNREIPSLHALSEDSDSSSDDGIEEAIRHYQQEQLKEKSILKPLSDKTKKIPISKYSTKGLQGNNTENPKKRKLKKNKTKDVLPVGMPSSTLLDSVKGNALQSYKVEGFKRQCAPPKTNTTAELMCAEAILDISKTVMPGAFQQAPGLSSSSLVGSCAQPSLSDTKLEDKSDDSSIDSEDGIEQEIRRFLEQKAQMHKQTQGSAATPEPADENESLQATCVKKPGRLSLTKKRKQKADNLSFCTVSALSNVKGTMSKTFSDSSDDSLSPASPTHTSKGERSGDKSSSLDSDEDLDLAIKDLLKTKKKVKKKTRDMKRKPEKCIKKEQLQVYASLSKTSKLDPLKHSSLKKLEKTKYELNFSKLTKHSFLQNNDNTGIDVNKPECEGTDLTISALSKPMKEEDSSVDSDDSIELEIRRFLAEKAKVATEEHSKNKAVSANCIAPICSEIKAEDVKKENQLAEIPSTNMPLPGPTESKLTNEQEKLSLSSPQSFPLRPLAAGAQSQPFPSPACSPSLLEPAKGAEVTQPRTPCTDSGSIQGASLSKEPQSVLSPQLTASQSASIKWRQSLGLPITDSKIRTPFQISSSKTNDTSSATRPSQSVTNLKIQSPAWSSTKTIATPFPRNTETAVNSGFRPHALNFLSSARPHPGPFTQRLTPSFGSQYHIEEETKSMVHISKDKSVYVELETNRTNHVQVRSRDRCEENESPDIITANSRERKREKTDNKEVSPEIKGENFIDEADYESGSKSNQGKKQGLSTLSLSSAIDPGFTFKPCIALTTEERSERFSRRCTDDKCRKGRLSWRSGNLQQSVQHVKRRLLFVPVHRINDARGLQKSNNVVPSRKV